MRSLLRLLCAVVLVASIVVVLRPDSVAGNSHCPLVTGEPNRDDLKSDVDGDGLFDFEEIAGISFQIHGETLKRRTDPTNCDTDGDGLKDGEEVKGVQITIEGIKTTVPMHREILQHADFVDGGVDTTWVERTWLS